MGGPLLTEEKMERLTLLANQEGWPMRIHTVGDRAVELTLLNFNKRKKDILLMRLINSIRLSI